MTEWLIWAQQDATNTPLLVTLATMAVSSIGAVVAARYSYLTTKAKLQYDAERIKLVAEVASQKATIDRMGGELQHLKDREAQCQKDVAGLRAEVKELQRINFIRDADESA